MLSKELIIRGNKTIDMIEYFEGIAFKEYNEKISFMKNDHHETFTLFKYSIKTKDWLVDLSEDKEIYIGSMTFPEVVVRITANEDRIESLIYDFRIQFLSAGG